MNFLDVLMEAKGDKKDKPLKIKVNTEEDTETTDYSNEDEEDTSEEVEGEEEDSEDESTDYTEEEDEVDPEEDGVDPEETEDETTDYSEDAPDDSIESGDSPEEGEEVEDPEAASENENNRILMDDFVNLYYTSKNTISKLSSIDKSNIAINMIVTQITSNLNMFTKQLFEYITFTFAANKYVTNLYKYNYFLEAFRINVQMLKKISVFVPN